MAHHQMAFNLLQGVDDHADQNEKRRPPEELGESVLDIEEVGQRRHDGDESDEK